MAQPDGDRHGARRTGPPRVAPRPRRADGHAPRRRRGRVEVPAQAARVHAWRRRGARQGGAGRGVRHDPESEAAGARRWCGRGMTAPGWWARGCSRWSATSQRRPRGCRHSCQLRDPRATGMLVALRVLVAMVLYMELIKMAAWSPGSATSGTRGEATV